MRINVIPVCELMDQHLVAEYREIKMLPKALIKTIKSKKGFLRDKVPEKYTLGKGHGYFFYDKLKFIDNRFDELLHEMKKRGFETKSNKLYYDDFDYSLIAAGPGYFNDYTPTKEDIELNRQIIKDRISEVKNFYRYYGKLIKGEKDMEKVHLCKSCSETKNCDWYNATPGVGMYECEDYVKKLDFSKHICDVCKTIDEKCPRGLKRDDRDIVVTQCSFFDEYKNIVGDCTTNFFENKYDRKIIGKDGRECIIDVYDVLKSFEVKCPALQHLIKKALCAGLRGHKDIGTDLQDIIDSAVRAKELYKKD